MGRHWPTSALLPRCSPWVPSSQPDDGRGEFHQPCPYCQHVGQTQMGRHWPTSALLPRCSPWVPSPQPDDGRGRCCRPCPYCQHRSCRHDAHRWDGTGRTSASLPRRSPWVPSPQPDDGRGRFRQPCPYCHCQHLEVGVRRRWDGTGRRRRHCRDALRGCRRRNRTMEEVEFHQPCPYCQHVGQTPDGTALADVGVTAAMLSVGAVAATGRSKRSVSAGLVRTASMLVRRRWDGTGRRRRYCRDALRGCRRRNRTIEEVGVAGLVRTARQSESLPRRSPWVPSPQPDDGRGEFHQPCPYCQHVGQTQMGRHWPTSALLPRCSPRVPSPQPDDRRGRCLPTMSVLPASRTVLRFAFGRNACGRVCTGRCRVDHNDTGSRANLCGRRSGLNSERPSELFAGFSRLAGTAALQIGAHLPRHLRLQRHNESIN